MFALLGIAMVQNASAASLLNPDGTVALGVNSYGHLNVSDVYDLASNSSYLGISRYPGPGDATTPGCLCEGWGVSASGVSGYANVSTDGVVGLALDSFTSDDTGAGAGTWATSSVHLTGLPGLKVTQHYAVSADNSEVFVDKVTITNDTAGTLTDVRYVRVMDWDIPPTEFSELVTIKGTATTAELERSHDGGFSTANPLGGDYAQNGSTVNVDFEDNGPADHGAYFRFNFGDLDAGESKEFSVFYGAHASETSALLAMGDIGAELFSFGQANPASSASEVTYSFAFKGVGGKVIVPPTGVPDSGSTLLMSIGGLICLLTLRRRFGR